MPKTKQLSHDITAIRELINNSLKDVLNNRISFAEKISADYGDLWSSIKEVSLAGGKRIRPYLVTLSFASYGGDIDSEDLIKVATAVELFHIAILMHDDVIDRDTKRHGRNNIGGIYSKKYSEYLKNMNDIQHYSSGSAILAGDLLIAEAYNLLNRLDVASDIRIAVLNVFHNSVIEVCGGELLDVEASFKKDKFDTVLISEYKTASYSFVSPLLVGATLAGASNEEQTKLRYFSRSLGIAYQFKDDLLGVFGDQDKTGKTNVGDIREAKRTFLIEEFYRLASNEDKESFNKFFGNNNLSDLDYLRVKELLINSGAKEAVEKKINELKFEAEGFLESLNINKDNQKSFKSFVELCLGRDG